MRTLPPGKYHSTSGFSLMELVVVLLLIGLAAALVVPSFTTGLKSLQLEASTRDLVTHMKQLRSAAISEQEVFRVILRNDVEGNYYLITDAYQQELKRYPLPEDFGFVLPDGQEEMVVSFYANGRSSGQQFGVRMKSGKEIRVGVDSITGLAGIIRPEREEG